MNAHEQLARANRAAMAPVRARWLPGHHLSGKAQMRQLISSGSRFEAEIGYSRAVADGDWIFVSGTTGFDYANMTISPLIQEQAEQALRNIESALREAGSSLADVVRVHYILPDAADFSACWPVLRRHFEAIRPAATVFVAGLADPRMKIEIEVTARRKRHSLPSSR